MRRPPLLVLTLAAAGCGGGSHSSGNADAAISAVVKVAYSRTPPSACERLFTPGLMRDVWGGVAGCRAHMRSLAKLTPATVRVVGIHRRGPVADARLRVGDTDETARLVLTQGRWQVDDTIGPQGSLRAAGSG